MTAGFGTCAWLVAWVASGLLDPAVALTPDPSPIAGLPLEDAETLIEYLGEGVVGSPVAADSIDDPSSWFPFENAILTFRITAGKGKGSTEQHVCRRLDGGQDTLSRTQWQTEFPKVGFGQIDEVFKTC